MTLLVLEVWEKSHFDLETLNFIILVLELLKVFLVSPFAIYFA